MPTDIVKRAASLSDQVTVGFSAGKDSIVTLDLCARFFTRVTAYFMYTTPGLSYQEAYWRQIERRYGIEIVRHRLPHWARGTALAHKLLPIAAAAAETKALLTAKPLAWNCSPGTNCPAVQHFEPFLSRILVENSSPETAEPLPNHIARIKAVFCGEPIKPSFYDSPMTKDTPADLSPAKIVQVIPMLLRNNHSIPAEPKTN